jgi:site-specific DNA recombinase
MRVALYARVSTERQERERTIGSQVEALEARAAAEGWVVELSCADDGHTGARLDRPGLDQVRDAAAARRIDAVIALCPDRLARNYVHQALVLEELARFGVSVIFLEGGHADDPSGRLLAQIQAAVAEFERTKIVDRNRRGKLWRARQGEVVSGAVPYGYRKVRATAGLPGRVEVCEEEATVVRRAFDWHANDGLSIRQIAIRLIEAGIPSPKGKPIWHPATVDALLRQEAYAGTLYYNRRITRADAPRPPRHSAEHEPLTQTRPREEWIGIAVPPLVDLGTWSRSQAQHSRNARFSPRHAGPGRYLLRYLVHCDECGQVRQAHRRAKPNGEYRYYRCTTALPMRLRAEKLRCSQPSARADELDELVWNEVTRHLHHPELILRACAPPAASTLTTDAIRQLTDLRSQQARLIDAYQAGVISLRDLEARRRPVTDRIGELEQLARHAEHHRLSQAELKQRIDDFASEVTDGLEAMDFDRRQQLVRTVLDKVVVSESRVEILFKIPLPGTPKEGRSPAGQVSRLRPERQDPPETRLPLSRAPQVLRPAHRRRTDLRHRQGPRQQQHRARLVPPHGPDPDHALARLPARRPQPADPHRLERPPGRRRPPRRRRPAPQDPPPAPQDPHRPGHRGHPAMTPPANPHQYRHHRSPGTPQHPTLP